MTWEEFCEKAKEMGYEANPFCIQKRYDAIHFWCDGRISYDYPDDSFQDIAYKRTPEQMLMIMKGLE